MNVGPGLRYSGSPKVSYNVSNLHCVCRIFLTRNNFLFLVLAARTRYLLDATYKDGSFEKAQIGFRVVFCNCSITNNVFVTI